MRNEQCVLCACEVYMCACVHACVCVCMCVHALRLFMSRDRGRSMYISICTYCDMQLSCAENNSSKCKSPTYLRRTALFTILELINMILASMFTNQLHIHVGHFRDGLDHIFWLIRCTEQHGRLCLHAVMHHTPKCVYTPGYVHADNYTCFSNMPPALEWLTPVLIDDPP